MRPSRFPRRLPAVQKPSALGRLYTFFFPDDTKIKIECTTFWKLDKYGLKLTRRFYTFRSFFWHYVYAVFITPFRSHAEWRRRNPTAELYMSPQYGAIAFDNSTSGTGNLSISHTCTGSNLVLVGGHVNVDDVTQLQVTSMTYNGVALTAQINNYYFLNAESSYRNLDIRYLASPATGANTFVINNNDANTRSKVGGCISLSGCNTTTPVDTGTSSTSHTEGVKTTAPAITVTTANANTMLIEFGNMQLDSDNTTVGGSETARWELVATTQGHCLGIASTRSTTAAGSYTNTWTKTGDYFGGWVTGIIGINEKVTSFSQTLSEAVTIADTITRSTTKVVSEAVILADTIARSVTRIFSEALALADTALRTVQRTLTEAITIADAITRSVTVVLTQQITLAEVFTTARGRATSIGNFIIRSTYGAMRTLYEKGRTFTLRNN